LPESAIPFEKYEDDEATTYDIELDENTNNDIVDGTIDSVDDISEGVNNDDTEADEHVDEDEAEERK